jgi:hypothetical protein
VAPQRHSQFRIWIAACFALTPVGSVPPRWIGFFRPDPISGPQVRAEAAPDRRQLSVPTSLGLPLRRSRSDCGNPRFQMDGHVAALLAMTNPSPPQIQFPSNNAHRVDRVSLRCRLATLSSGFAAPRRSHSANPPPVAAGPSGRCPTAVIYARHPGAGKAPLLRAQILRPAQRLPCRIVSRPIPRSRLIGSPAEFVFSKPPSCPSPTPCSFAPAFC